MYSKFGQFIDGKWQQAEKSETYDVINPATGLHKFTVELLDENYNSMKSLENQVDITESGISTPDLDTSGGYGSEGGGSS